MSEVWLHGNRRLFVGPILVAAIAALSFAVKSAMTPKAGGGWWLATAAASAVGVGLWFAARRPRLAFDGRSLLLYVQNGGPVAVPIDLVEAFLLGKGPTFLSGRDDYKTETTTLIVRIAERAEEFAKVETNVRFAAWCGHYVTLRGTWTEPLSIELVNRLNQRLYDVQQALHKQRGAAASPAS